MELIHSPAFNDVYKFFENNRGMSYTFSDLVSIFAKYSNYSRFNLMDAINALVNEDCVRALSNHAKATSYQWKSEIKKKPIKLKLNFNGARSNI